MKNKNVREISAEEERIKTAVKMDIDVASKRAGNWQEIEELAYEPHDRVKRSSLSFGFPVVCAVMLAASLTVMQLFSESFYDFKHSPKAAMSCDDGGGGGGGEKHAELADEGYSEPYIGSISSNFSVDESGEPYTGYYELDVPVFFPHEEGYTDYGSVYFYAVCEGETLYVNETEQFSYTAGETEDMKIRFEMKQITAEESPQVTVIALFLRDGGLNSRAAARSVSLKNPYYSEDNADAAHEKTTNEFTFDPLTVQVPQELEITNDGESETLRFRVSPFYTDEEYDIVLMTAGGGAEPTAEQLYMNYSQANGGSLFTKTYEGRYILDDYIEEKAAYASESCVFAAAVPRGGGSIVLSPVYDVSEFVE